MSSVGVGKGEATANIAPLRIFPSDRPSTTLPVSRATAKDSFRPALSYFHRESFVGHYCCTRPYALSLLADSKRLHAGHDDWLVSNVQG